MTVQRYGASAAPRADGCFVMYGDYETLAKENERLRYFECTSIEDFIALLRREGNKLASSFSDDVYGPLLDTASSLEEYFGTKEQS